jgi:Uma2 family endonuclease
MGPMLLGSSENPMISLADEYRAAIRHAFDALPEGTWAEIVDGEIEVSPFPINPHQLIVRYLNLLLAVAIPKGWEIETSGGLIIKPDMQEYRPDIYIAPAEAWRVNETPGADPGQVELVVEVVSPGKRDRERDRVAKYRAYAHVGIPFYLLVDRYEGGGFVTLYSNPSDGQYLDAHKVPFGEKLRLPAPFEVEIDTARF